MTYDAGALHEELAQAGLNIRSVGSDGSIDWSTPPTGADLATAKGVMAAHDPGKRERERGQEKAQRLVVADRLRDATLDIAAWSGLTAAERHELTRQALRAVAELLRRA